MIKLSKERLRAALPRLTPAEQDELLTLLTERVEVETTEARWTEIEATRPSLDSFMPSGASEYAAVAPCVVATGERPPSRHSSRASRQWRHPHHAKAEPDVVRHARYAPRVPPGRRPRYSMT